MPQPRVPMQVRFWKHVDKSGECWVWTGAMRNFGRWRYGAIKADAPSRRMLVASRVAYELAHERRLSQAEVICHRCDNTMCVRPDHLFVGSHRDNTQDMIAKGRHPIFRLSAQQAEDIRRRYAAGDTTQVAIAVAYGVTQPCINKIVRGTRQVGKVGM